MRITWRTELPQLVLVAAMFVVALAVWPFAPERMPVHWIIRGEVDGYGNKFVGIRTPWTLSSDRSWQKTHRVGGWLLLALGPLLALVGLLRSGWYLTMVLGITGVSLIGLVAYSYWVYRQDSQRRGP